VTSSTCTSSLGAQKQFHKKPRQVVAGIQCAFTNCKKNLYYYFTCIAQNPPHKSPVQLITNCSDSHNWGPKKQLWIMYVTSYIHFLRASPTVLNMWSCTLKLDDERNPTKCRFDSRKWVLAQQINLSRVAATQPVAGKKGQQQQQRCAPAEKSVINRI
jgi:hypothetical protein